MQCLDGYESDPDNINNCKRINNLGCEFADYVENNCNTLLSTNEIISEIRNMITNQEINNILNNIINNEAYISKVIGNTILEIISLDNQNLNNNENVATIELNDCKEILNEKYGLENKSILLYKTNTKIEGYSTISVNYELYNPNNFSKLNLDYCNKTSIYIKIPVSINPDEIFKYDPKSDYYNDMCFPYNNEDGADVIIKDRKDEFIDNNMSLCENNCEFKDYDLKIEKMNLLIIICLYAKIIVNLKIMILKIKKQYVNVKLKQ